MPWSNDELGEVPDGRYTVPLGTQRHPARRRGADDPGRHAAHVAMTAAAETGIDAEIIDLRTCCRHPELDPGIGAQDGRCVIVRSDADLRFGRKSCRRWCRRP